MPNVTAQYWGIKVRVNCDIGEIQFFSPTLVSGGKETLTEVFGDNYQSTNAVTTDMTYSAVLGALDGDMTTQQTISGLINNDLIGIELPGLSVVRQILVRNVSTISGNLPIPFGIDGLGDFVTAAGAGSGKVITYSVSTQAEYSGVGFLICYTILPVAETDNPSIARGSLTKPKIGAC